MGDEPHVDGPVDLFWSLAADVQVEWPDPVTQAMDALEGVDRAFRMIEVRRVLALLTAFELGMSDLAERFGPSFATRGGVGARAFFKQVASTWGMREGAVARMLDAATEARASMPLTWAVFTAGRATWQAVDTAVRQIEGLGDDRLPEYDRVAADAVERTAVSRLKDKLRRSRERLQADTAIERRRAAEANRRVELEPLGDGEAALIIRGPAVQITAIDHALTKAAIAAHGHPDEDRAIGTLRYDLVQDLLLEGIKHAADPAVEGSRVGGRRVPQRKGVVPQVFITVPALTLLGHGDEPATLVNYGPIDFELARELAAAAPSFTRILTHPLIGVRLKMDRKVYAPPADLRRWLHVRDEFCRGPGCRRAAHLCDIDHVQEWHENGLTEDSNLVSLCRPDHLLKSVGLWTSELQADARVRWTSPWGRTVVTEPAEPSDSAPPHLLPADTTDPSGSAPAEDDDCPF